MNEDILQPMSDDEHLNYLNNYKNHLPECNRPYYFLIYQQKCKSFQRHSLSHQQWHQEISSKVKYNLYKYSTSEPLNSNHSTFFAITYDNWTIYFNTLEEECNELRYCLELTNRIDWKIKPRFQYVSSSKKHLQLLKEIINKKQYEIEWETVDVGVWLTKEKSLAINYEIPPDVYVKELHLDDSRIINEIWPHRYPGSEEYFRSMILLNGGIGIYQKHSNTLISWVIVNDTLGAGSLQTIDTEKRKGYGRLILKIFIKNFIAKENLPVIASIVTNNTISRRLFQKLGFEEFDEFNWVGIR